MPNPYLLYVVEDRHEPNTHSRIRQCKDIGNGVGIKEDKLKGSGTHTMVRAPPIYIQPIQERWALSKGIQRVWFGSGEEKEIREKLRTREL